ncbi:MAG: FAD-binding oxidoreductase [Hyphomicrobiales bacterium]|nr:FAD-binding oxidoreductase [Hyphomicrobiales bacterium]MCP5001252.1 FAD-binding oxidoreductase [Hyphomicrobiales bacterium]
MSEQSSNQFEIVVIGAGIAGASVAYELAAGARVAVLEMESQPGYHTTGRSAAVYSEIYGPAPMRALTSQSRAFYKNPPAVFGREPLLTPRGVLYIARSDQSDSLEKLKQAIAGQPGVSSVDAEEIQRLSPLLRPGYAVEGLFEENARGIDVNALHQGYLRGLRERGGEVITNAEVMSAERDTGVWTVSTRNGDFSAPVVINATGAWADEFAARAGVKPVGLVPMRRTALIVATPDGVNPEPWPVTVDADEQFYMKPDAGRLLISPADETPSEPCDAQPEEMDIAICIDRIQQAFALDIRRVENSWAGLRTFVDDHAPVCGFDPDAEGFFWLAGQGGYGIQSAPGLSQLAAKLVIGGPLPDGLEARGFKIDDVSPARLRY